MAVEHTFVTTVTDAKGNKSKIKDTVLKPSDTGDEQWAKKAEGAVIDLGAPLGTAHALGQEVWFEEGEGPRLTPIATLDDVRRLGAAKDPLEHLAPVIETVRRLRAELPAETTLLGFCGAPWTLASYMIAGRSSPEQAPLRLAAYRDPAFLAGLIDTLVATSIRYLVAQIDAGADAVQIFESMGTTLPPAMVETHSLGPLRRIVEGVERERPGARVIVFVRGGGVVFESREEGDAGHLDEGAAVVLVPPDRLGADEPARHLPEERLAAGEQPQPHPVGRPEAEAGGVADDDVRADVGGAFEQRERHEVGSEDVERLVLVREGSHLREGLLDHPAEGRGLRVDHHAVLADEVRESVDVDRAVVHRVGLDREVAPHDVVLQDLAAALGEVLGDEHPVAGRRPDTGGEGRGLAERRRRVVHRAVRHREPREFDQQRLVLEQRLEEPLCDLGLVLGVAGEELRAVGEVVDDRGDVVGVSPPAEELDEVVVALERRGDLPDEAPLVAGFDTERAVEPDRFGDVEQRLLALDADRLQHRVALGRRVRRERAPPVTAHGYVPPGSWLALTRAGL